jgi:hypothetical protein
MHGFDCGPTSSDSAHPKPADLSEPPSPAQQNQPWKSWAYQRPTHALTPCRRNSPHYADIITSVGGSRLSLAAVVVVTQTLVELIGMVLYVRYVPRLVPGETTAATGQSTQ